VYPPYTSRAYTIHSHLEICPTSLNSFLSAPSMYKARSRTAQLLISPPSNIFTNQYSPPLIKTPRTSQSCNSSPSSPSSPPPPSQRTSAAPQAATASHLPHAAPTSKRITAATSAPPAHVSASSCLQTGPHFLQAPLRPPTATDGLCQSCPGLQQRRVLRRHGDNF
jgi:hypothetical protein